MDFNTLDYGYSESGTISNSSLQKIGIQKVEYDKVLSINDNQLTHMTVTTMDGKTIDLGNYDIASARDLIRESILNTSEGFKQLCDMIEGV